MSAVISDIKFIEGYLENDTDITRNSFPEFLDDPGTATWFTKAVQPQNYSRYNNEEDLDTLTTQGDINSNTETRLHDSGTDSSVSRIDEMVYLAALAQPSNRSDFVARLQAINWAARPASDFVQALQLALSVGAFMEARQLAFQAVEYYPQHGQLQKHVRLLGLPKVTGNDLPPNPTLKANQVWLKANRTAFRGQWVALRDGQLLGSADSLQTLVDQIGRSEEVLLTKVF